MRVEETAEVVEAPKRANRNNRQPEQPNTLIHIASVVKSTRNGRVGILFEGFGILLDSKRKYKVNDEIEIQFIGTIGKPDFRCWVAE